MPEDIEAAAEAVSEYMQGREVKENTVLAAYIRREGAVARGDVWSLAKHFLKQGHSFESAARSAVHGLQSDQSVTSSPSSGDETDAPRQVDLEFEAGSVRENIKPAQQLTMRPLDWYPKKYSPGDIDGDGAKKLLGTPSIPLASVLVRETAQNSWDARTGLSDVGFEINMRLLTQGETDVLREVCFPETAAEVDIVEAMAEPIWVLEVSDRGTVGLRGPTRNDLSVPEGQPTNFIDLVFNLGGKHEIDSAGGTYGFGKTVAYKASRLGAVLIWSRIATRAGFEDRIIGSSIGDRFDMDGYRYTGRHWWGRQAEEDGYIQPLTGEEASVIGDAVFSRGFSTNETGTSLLILCPELGSESPEQDVALLAEAVRWHLWPKRLEAQSGDVSMTIDVQLNGRSIQIFSETLENPMLDSLETCLRAVRAVQSGEDVADSYPPVEIQQVWCQRPLTLLGHLAMQRFPDRPIHTFAEEIMPIEQPGHHVALMRNSAELVVKYIQGLPLDTPGFKWAGVFKPVPDLDRVFAASEPPAHDDWVPDGTDDKWSRTQVRVGLRRIKEIADAFAQPIAPIEEQRQGRGSVAGLADALADLIPLISSSRPEPRPPRDSVPGSRKPKVAVTAQILGPADSRGNRIVALQLLVTGASLPASLKARSSVGVEGGSDHDAEVEVVGWSAGKPTLKLSEAVGGDQSTYVSADDNCWVMVRSKSELAVDVQIDVVG